MTTLDTRQTPHQNVPHTVDVSIVLPCLNEEESVAACVTEALDACALSGLVAEVIVVDNNCTDHSAERARWAGARVIKEATPGYGAAIRAGIAASDGAVVVMADADSTYPLDRIAELVAPVLEGRTDIMIGSRLCAANRHSMPFLHRFLGTPALTYLVREGSGLPSLSDSQSGFRAFRRDTVTSLGLASTGMEFASEMLIRATQQELRIAETSLGYRERVGESKLDTWSDGLRHLKLIVRLSPHLVLWYPGELLVVCALALFGLSLATPSALTIGSSTWQPVFFCSTLLVFGFGGMLAGAVLGYHSPLASRKIRLTFSWIADATVMRRLRRFGSLVALAGLSLNLGLYIAAMRHVSIALHARITLSGLAQSLLLSGTLFVVFTLLYALLAPARAATVSSNKDVGSCAS